MKRIEQFLFSLPAQFGAIDFLHSGSDCFVPIRHIRYYVLHIEKEFLSIQLLNISDRDA